MRRGALFAPYFASWGRSWGSPGALLGRSWAPRAALGASRGRPGGHFGVILELFLAPFEGSSMKLAIFENLAPRLHGSIDFEGSGA